MTRVVIQREFKGRSARITKDWESPVGYRLNIMNKTEIENMHFADYKSYADKHNWAERISKNFFSPKHWWNCKQSEHGMSPMELAMSGNCIEVENMIRNMEKVNLV